LSRVSFVYSNPRHHAEMMAPVMAALIGRGVRCRAVSMAELRGFATSPLPVPGIDLRRAVPARVRKDPSMGASFGIEGGRARPARRAAQLAVWAGWLAPRLAWLTRDSDAVVVPNDAAFPYREIASMSRMTGKPFVLMQEGIRFPLPGVREEDAYGRGGAAAICAWGEASAEYFRSQGAPADRIQVTGNPRFDGFDAGAWRTQGDALARELGLARPPLLYLSNPIDDQGYCTTTEKMALFRRFADEVADLLAESGRMLVVKLHPREDVAAFRRAAAESRAGERVRVLDDVSIFAALACCGAAVVLASTVGLEALLFGRPLGVLAVPGAGFVFDYVQSGAARGLELGDGLAGRVEALLGDGDGAGGRGGRGAAARGPANGANGAAGATSEASDPAGAVRARYLERHLAHRGSAAERIASLIEGLRRRA